MPTPTHLLVSPLTRGAYYDAALEVARAELEAHFPERAITHHVHGPLDLFGLELEGAERALAARLTLTQGQFAARDGALVPLEVGPAFALPADMVWGSKYRGKTNELVTQLALNLAILHCDSRTPPKTLLDPMAGQGTTLLWGMRYGLDGRGIEKDPGALDAMHRHVKKQTKLHRISHDHQKGFVGRKNKSGEGAFTHYAMAGHHVRLITGDSRDAPELLAEQRFDLIVCDLPYGIQHKSGRHTLAGLIGQCAPAWVDSLRVGGAMVLIFNTYRPERAELARIFEELGCTIGPFTAPHRMSESIVRDLLVVTKPSTDA